MLMWPTEQNIGAAKAEIRDRRQSIARGPSLKNIETKAPISECRGCYCREFQVFPYRKNQKRSWKILLFRSFPGWCWRAYRNLEEIQKGESLHSQRASQGCCQGPIGEASTENWRPCGRDMHQGNWWISEKWADDILGLGQSLLHRYWIASWEDFCILFGKLAGLWRWEAVDFGAVFIEFGDTSCWCCGLCDVDIFCCGDSVFYYWRGELEHGEEFEEVCKGVLWEGEHWDGRKSPGRNWEISLIDGSKPNRVFLRKLVSG